MFFKKKKLTLKEMNELYLLLAPTLPKEEEKYLIDQVYFMLDKMSVDVMTKALIILYGKIPKGSSLNVGMKFIQGLKDNEFFVYAKLVRDLKNGRLQRTSKD